MLDPKDIAIRMGLKIIYEKPIENDCFLRISEYRKKTKQIVVFYSEFEKEAIAHELFHHLENILNLKLKKTRSEELAERFADIISC